MGKDVFHHDFYPLTNLNKEVQLPHRDWPLGTEWRIKKKYEWLVISIMEKSSFTIVGMSFFFNKINYEKY